MSPDSLGLKGCLAVCIALTLFATTSLDDSPSNAANFEFKAVGQFGLPLKTSWFGLKPFTYFSDFFAAAAHDQASSRPQPESSTISVKV